MVEGFGRRQFVSEGEFMRRKVRPSRNHQSVLVKEENLLASVVDGNTLIDKCRND
jgi:hypothetical protein